MYRQGLLIFSAMVAYVAVSWVYFRILKIALQKNLVDVPNGRKMHRQPVPILGGVAVFFGVIVGSCIGLVCARFAGIELSFKEFGLICAMIIMLVVGVIDDVSGLTARFRLVVEVLVVLFVCLVGGCSINSLDGLWGIGAIDPTLALALTVFACVGIVNAINMIDGVTGLCSSMCVLFSLCFGCYFAANGMYFNTLVNCTMAASLLPFLFHNVAGEKSKMFIGDGGTMTIGMLMGWNVIQVLSTCEAETTTIAETTTMAEGSVAMCVAILAHPVFDCVRVMTMRMLKGRSPFKGDRTHLHHIVLEYTGAHALATMWLVLMAVAIMCIFVLSVAMGLDATQQFYAVVVSAATMVWGAYFYLRLNINKKTGAAAKFRDFNGSLRQKFAPLRTKLQQIADRNCHNS